MLHRLTGDFAKAEVRLRQALDLFQELETRWQIGRTFFELGELALAWAETKEARDYFSRALWAFEEIGAKPDAARARTAIASLD